MDDVDYAAELLALLRAPGGGQDAGAPVDRCTIDRSVGFVADVPVTSVEVVPGEHGDQLDVGFVLTPPDEPRWQGLSRTGSVRVPFDAEWRRLSGFGTPTSYAPEVARAVEGAAQELVEKHLDADEDDWGPELPDRGTQWRWLLDGLAVEGAVRQVEAGRVEVVVNQPDGPGQRLAPLLTAVVTPEQWEQVLTHEVSTGDSNLYLGEILSPRDPDEAFLVFFDGRLVMSTREELPPVRGRAEERWFADLKAETNGGAFGWYAYAPLDRP